MLSKYIGIPFVDRKASFRGADCFGLIRLFYMEQLGIKIYEHKSKYDNIKSVIMEYLHESETNWTSHKEPELYDVVAMAHDMNHPDIIQHFGIYIGNGKMLHTLQKVGSHIVNIRDYKYFIKGYHRWQK